MSASTIGIVFIATTIINVAIINTINTTTHKNVNKSNNGNR
jgi:hypothetical protein